MENEKMNVSGVSQNIIEKVKKTKNTTVKNLTVHISNGDVSETKTIKNMYQVWNFIKGFYNDEKNLDGKITVFQDDKLLKDIHAEKKASGKIWMVDRLQIGQHVKNK